MMTKFFIGLCLFWSLETYAQTSSTTLPNWVIDSLLYEAKYSRQCDTVRVSLLAEIEALNKELNATGKALVLSQSSNETLSALINNSRDANTILGMQFQKDLNSEKKKTRRWRKVAVIETVGLIGLLILLL